MSEITFLVFIILYCGRYIRNCADRHGTWLIERKALISKIVKNESLSKLNEVGIEKFRQINFQIDPSLIKNNHDKHRLLRAYSIFLQTKKNLSYGR